MSLQVPADREELLAQILACFGPTVAGWLLLLALGPFFDLVRVVRLLWIKDLFDDQTDLSRLQGWSPVKCVAGPGKPPSRSASWSAKPQSSRALKARARLTMAAGYWDVPGFGAGFFFRARLATSASFWAEFEIEQLCGDDSGTVSAIDNSAPPP